MITTVTVRIVLKFCYNILGEVVVDLVTSDFFFWTQTYGMEVGSFLCCYFPFFPAHHTRSVLWDHSSWWIVLRLYLCTLLPQASAYVLMGPDDHFSHFFWLRMNISHISGSEFLILSYMCNCEWALWIHNSYIGRIHTSVHLHYCPFLL